MVELSGLSLKNVDYPLGDIEISITGLRPGEKLYEELLIGDKPLPTSHPRIMKANEDFLAWEVLEFELAKLEIALSSSDMQAVRDHLRSIVQGYEPDGAVVDWIYLNKDHEYEEN
jgi:FlaA1/EpsC-like NDP-sugar epimerase